MKCARHLQHITRQPVQTNIPSTLGLKMTSVHKAINTDHRYIALMVARRTGDNELARNRIMVMEWSESFDVGQWMQVNTEMTWKFEDDMHLCDMDCWNACQHTFVVLMRSGMYHWGQKSRLVDVLHPTQKPYQILRGSRPCVHQRWLSAWHESFASYCHVL